MYTKLEIIDETVEWYSTDTSRRSLNTSDGNTPLCMYKNQKGNKCAMGRCADEEWLDQFYREKGHEPQINVVFDNLKKEYQGHNESFWQRLQGLHDNRMYWGKNCLTESGKLYVTSLKEKYK